MSAIVITIQSASRLAQEHSNKFKFKFKFWSERKILCLWNVFSKAKKSLHWRTWEHCMVCVLYFVLDDERYS